QAWSGASGQLCKSLSNWLGWVIMKSAESWVLSKQETLSSQTGAVHPKDSSVRKQSSLNTTSALWHGLHFPSRISSFRSNSTAAGVCRTGDVLVRSTTADNDLAAPVVLGRERQQDTSTGVGVG